MKIKKNIPIGKNQYEDFYDESLYIDFICPNSNKIISIDVLLNFHLLENLVNKRLIQIEEITKNGMAKLTTKHNSYLGIFCVQNNLSAYYNLINCDDKNYIVVFGFGEVQAGRNILYISGIWEITD